MGKAAMTKVILDVDTGSDDAVAIMLAAMHPNLDLMACTTVNGNVELPYTTDNTLRVLDHIGHSDVPVYAGMSHPIVRSDFPLPRHLNKDTGIHGKHLPLPEAISKAQEKGAVEFLLETYRNATDEIVLVPVGPLTNIAAAITLDPSFVKRVPELVIMGGGHALNNRTPSAEFNIWADPEAAAMVFRAGFEKITLVPLDATHKALISLDQAEKVEALGTNAAKAFGALMRQRITAYDARMWGAPLGAAPVHDACCIAFLIDRGLLKTEHYHVDVETRGELTVGRTVVDTLFKGNGTPNCDFAVHADGDVLFNIFMDTFGRA